MASPATSTPCSGLDRSVFHDGRHHRARSRAEFAPPVLVLWWKEGHAPVREDSEHAGFSIRCGREGETCSDRSYTSRQYSACMVTGYWCCAITNRLLHHRSTNPWPPAKISLKRPQYRPLTQPFPLCSRLLLSLSCIHLRTPFPSDFLRLQCCIHNHSVSFFFLHSIVLAWLIVFL